MTKCNKTLLIICLVLVFSISITFAFVSLNYSVNAEELTNNSVLNFNQIANYYTLNNDYYSFTASSVGGYSYNISLKNQSVWWARFNVTSSVLDISHKYYISQSNDKNLLINYYNNSTSTPELIGSLSSGNSVIVSSVNDLGISFDTSNASVFPLNFNLMLIDLTQTFGAGNEPTNVHEFKSYFNNDYYPYTSSTLISLSTLDAYTNGVNDTLSNLTYSFTAVDSYNRITNANVKINNISYDSTLNKTTLGADFVSLGVPGSTQNGVLYFPFSTTLNAGDTISLTGYYGYAVFGSGSYSVDIVIVNGDSYSIIDTSTKTGSTINDLKYIDNLKFTLPYSCSGIYFICEGAGVYVSNFTISLQVFNFQSLINDAYKSGQDSVDTAAIESEAYQKGKQDGIALKGDNVWSNANEFIKNIFVGIFDILSIEFLPNVSLGTFVVIPLIFSVLFFIVKVSKGGGD